MKNVADIARLFGVGRGTIINWCSEFREHLSTSAITKGQPRLFNQSDLRVFAVIHQYWEDNPDYENIHACLNSGDYNSEEYMEFSYLNTSFFQDANECEYEGDEAWTNGILLGGIGSKIHLIEIARSYKNAADELVELVKKSHEPYDLAYPIFFTYRHTLELYLKIIAKYDKKKDKEKDKKDQIGHYLDRLITEIETQYNEKLPLWIKERLIDFHSIDPLSTSFRFFDEIPNEIRNRDEIWIDFIHLNVVMDKLCNIFEQIIIKLKLDQRNP